MKNFCLLFSFIVFLFAGCNKDEDSLNAPPEPAPGQEYECSHSILYIRPCGIVFSGFTEAELQEIILSRYRGGTNFTELISRDTLRAGHIAFQDDLAYVQTDSTKECFWNIENEIDYQVSIPFTQSQYSVSGAKKGPDSETWIQYMPCSPGSGSAVISTLIDIHVDGVFVYPEAEIGYNYYISLKK